jgi:hypothetical protein
MPGDGPVPGLKLVSIGDHASYLLYSGHWFPVLGCGLNRLTATGFWISSLSRICS